MSEFGEKLKEFSKKKFGSVTKLAEALEMSQPQLSSYISGEVGPGLKILQDIQSLGCDMNWLLGAGNKKEDITKDKFMEKLGKLEKENKELRAALRAIELVSKKIRD